MADPRQQADDLLADLVAAFANGHPDPETVEELGERADRLVSSTDLSALLAATGIGDSEEHLGSLPAAVADGEPANVAALRSLLTAAKLPTDDGTHEERVADREEHVAELQSLVETAQDAPAAEAASDEPIDETVDADFEEMTDADFEEMTDAEEPTAPVRDLLESQLEATQALFDQVPDIEALTAGHGGDEVDESSSDSPADEPRDGDQSTRPRDGTRWRPGGKRRPSHSTVPAAGRQDIGRQPGRFSTVRGSTVSDR